MGPYYMDPWFYDPRDFIPEYQTLQQCGTKTGQSQSSSISTDLGIDVGGVKEKPRPPCEAVYKFTFEAGSKLLISAALSSITVGMQR